MDDSAIIAADTSTAATTSAADTGTAATTSDPGATATSATTPQWYLSDKQWW
jgi:hypothetical protein